MPTTENPRAASSIATLPGPASRIENAAAARLAQQGLDQIGLTVDALTCGGQFAPPLVVGVAAGRPGVLPTAAHDSP